MNSTILRRMPAVSVRYCLLFVFCLGSFSIAFALSDVPNSPIRLIPQDRSQIRTADMPAKVRALIARMPENVYHFGTGTPGKLADPQLLTLQFVANTSLNEIFSTRDFQLLPGGTCVKGVSYSIRSTCQIVMRFTPQGAGNRLGRLTVTSGDGELSTFFLFGFSYTPVVSFTPSVITTVPATVSGGKGVIAGAYTMAIDSGDTLYIADTGNGEIRYIDSSGTLTTIGTGSSTPTGIVVDTFGNIFFTNGAPTGAIYEIYNYATFAIPASGTGTDACTVSSPCNLANEQMYYPGEMSTDGYNNIFWANEIGGAAMSVVQPIPSTYITLYSPFTYQEQTLPDAFAVDANDNIYSNWAITTQCEIKVQALSDAENTIVRFWSAAGGRTCGFSGDGGKAVSAEIGAAIGQIVFDAAGNMYFTDGSNERVRRVDALTGIIRTIAGSGTAGNTGDNGPATRATLHSPTGLAVDSQGQVYILSNSATTGSAQVVRKVGTTGDLVFPSTKQGVASAPLIVNVANTGNLALNVLRDTLTGTDHADFTIDNNTTSCNFAAGNSLNAGQSCQIGVIFKPAAVGTRSATLNLVDNTVNAVNKVNLGGTAVAAAKVSFTAPASTQIAAGSKVTASVKVTSSYAVAPTGTVTFTLDGKAVASKTLSSAAASVIVGPLASGTHHVTAAYSGDKYHAAASATETLTAK